MRKASSTIRAMWTEEFSRFRGYAYKTVEGILAGYRNPLFPSSDTIEDIADDALLKAYETTTRNAHRIAQGVDPETRRKIFLGYLRNACRNAVRKHCNRSRPNLTAEPIAQTREEPDEPEGAEALLQTLPRTIRRTAELLSQGRSKCEIARALDIDRTTVFRHCQKLRELLGFALFCYRLESCLS